MFFWGQNDWSNAHEAGLLSYLVNVEPGTTCFASIHAQNFKGLCVVVKLSTWNRLLAYCIFNNDHKSLGTVAQTEEHVIQCLGRHDSGHHLACSDIWVVSGGCPSDFSCSPALFHF